MMRDEKDKNWGALQLVCFAAILPISVQENYRLHDQYNAAQHRSALEAVAKR